MKPVDVSESLAEIVGSGPMARTEVVKKLWEYIKKHKLQDKDNKRNIIPDKKLSQVFGSSQPIDMFKMTSKVSKGLYFSCDLPRILAPAVLVYKEVNRSQLKYSYRESWPRIFCRGRVGRRSFTSSPSQTPCMKLSPHTAPADHSPNTSRFWTYAKKCLLSCL